MENYINIILKKYNGKILRGDISFSKDSDIDIFINKNKYKKDILNKFLKYNFFIIENNSSKLTIGKFINKKLYIIDLEFNFSYVFKFIGNDIYYKQKLLNKYIENPSKKEYSKTFNTIRYLLMFRKNKKYLSYLEKQNIIDEINKWLNKPFLKKEIRYINYKKFIHKNKLYLFKILKFKYFLNLIKNTFKNYIKTFNSGKIITLTGIDGSGKSTICNILQKELGFYYIYGGSNNYILSNGFYQKGFFKNNIIGKIIKLILIYLENIYKIIKAYNFKLRGKNIIFDRYPKINNYAVESKNIGHKISNVLYGYFYPNIGINIFIKVKPEIILKRKNERTKKEIIKFNNNIKIYQKRFGGKIIENNSKIDDFLNYLIKNI